MMGFPQFSSGKRKLVEIILASDKDANLIARIARPIWEEHYTPIIGIEQVNYMLDKFQSEDAVQTQIAEGYHYYLVNYEGNTAGYMAIKLEDNKLFLSKFYLSSEYRGKGIAKTMMQSLIDQAKANDCQLGELTVNKYNPAYNIYLKLGFKNVESIQIDIGNGYTMDDFRMQLAIN